MFSRAGPDAQCKGLLCRGHAVAGACTDSSHLIIPVCPNEGNDVMQGSEEQAPDKNSSWGVNRDRQGKGSIPEVKRHVGEDGWLNYVGTLKDLAWLHWHLI